MIRGKAGLPSVCVIVVHYEGLKMLENCLESLSKTDYGNFQVILVDNGSKDDLQRLTTGARDFDLEVIRSNVNLGVVSGKNLALRQVKTDYAVLLDDDTVVQPNWLGELVHEAEKDTRIGACQPKLLSLRNPKFFEYNGACGGMLDVYGVPLTRGRIFDLAEEDSGQYNIPVEIFWASGAALFLRTSVVREVGLQDETFGAQMEEIDLCWRIRLGGYKVVSVPSSVVYHRGGEATLSEKFYLKNRNNLITIIKNYSGRNLVHFLPLRIVQDSFSFIYYLIKKERARSMPIIRAYICLLRNLHVVLLCRHISQRIRRVGDKEIIDAMVRKSVAIQHYILGRKYFSQLSGYQLKWRVTCVCDAPGHKSS
jgi:GT2 family glycosyltransferase